MNHLNYNCSVYNLSVVFWCTDMQFWYVHPVNIPLYVDHADCVKGTLPSVEKGSPRREDTLCSLALKSSAGALFDNAAIRKHNRRRFSHQY